MAEKEERISIELLKDDFCNTCDNRGKLKNCCCYEKQEYDERYQKSLSRQEAIDKMANALSLVQAKTFVDEIQWERVMNGCRYEAEAALNALLEEK